MSEKVKLIIEITKEHYEATKKLDKKYPYMLAGGETAIAHGIPLDNVKAEIDEQYDRVRPYNIDVAQGLEMALGILDNIGKESETN